MQSALALVRGFPPPTARPWVITRFHGPRARLTTDAGIALVEEFVVRHVVLMDIIAHLLLRPVDQRIDLHHAVLVVPLDELHVLSRDALLVTQATDPGVQALESTLQRLELTDGAATMTTLDTVVEQVDAFLPHHALHLPIIGEEHLDLDVIGEVRTVDKLIRLREEAARVKRKDPSRLVDIDNHLCQRLIFDGKR